MITISPNIEKMRKNYASGMLQRKTPFKVTYSSPSFIQFCTLQCRNTSLKTKKILKTFSIVITSRGFWCGHRCKYTSAFRYFHTVLECSIALIFQRIPCGHEENGSILLLLILWDRNVVNMFLFKFNIPLKRGGSDQRETTNLLNVLILF